MASSKWLCTRRLALAGALATSALVAAAGSGPAAAATQNTFSLSGQLSGKLTLNSSETCTSGNISKDDGVDDIRIYLTDHGVKPTNATWFLLIGAKKSGTTRFPASSPNEVSIGADSGIKTDDEWSTLQGGSGTVTLAGNLKSGSIDLKLAPAANQHGATRDEQIVGGWSCG
jgi:hypothetical protein